MTYKEKKVKYTKGWIIFEGPPKTSQHSQPPLGPSLSLDPPLPPFQSIPPTPPPPGEFLIGSDAYRDTYFINMMGNTRIKL